jgi:23S rRNA U2552 (ribose-2'-O)-methylase RlmE/FtsJ
MLNINDLPDDHIPVVYKLPTTKDIFKNKLDPAYSTNLSYPKFSFGFHHFIHQSKDKMSITSQFKNKKKVYYIMNKFERYVDDYDKSINDATKQYFRTDKKPAILSRAFFKLWEILFMFDLVQVDKPNFVSAHLAEGPGSFIQATMFFRDMYGSKDVSKNDKYYAVTLHDENSKKYVPPLDKEFIKYYEKEKPVRFMQHKTYSKKQSGGSNTKDNGDLLDVKTRVLFGGNFKDKKADFVSADGGFNWINENTQEQEAYGLILAQILTAVDIQAKDGRFVCKLYETFTDITAKFMVILNMFYKDVRVIKPLMSRTSNSEKYLVCTGYKFSTKDNERDRLIGKLEEFMKLYNNSKLNITDVFPEFMVEQEDTFKAALVSLNNELSNSQFKQVNEMITFIEEQNYRGDVYQRKREEQIVASNFWADTFLPDVKKFKSAKKDLEKFAEDIIQKNEKRIKKAEKILL